MPRSRVWVLCVVFGAACSPGPDDSSSDGGRANDAAGGRADGAGGRADASGGNGSGGNPTAAGGSGGPTSGGGANGGSTANGGAGANSAGGRGNSTSGGVGNAGASAGGRSSGGRSGMGQGGRARASGGTSAGSSSIAGAVSSAGAGSCVQNLGCMLAAPPSTGDIHQDCVDRVNQFRTQCACLPALARWTDGEPCADQMAQYDSEKDTAHAGFSANICKGGQGQNECPGWGSNSQVVSGCLQQMWNEGPPPTSSCSGDCFNQHGHYINMTSTSSTKVACGFYTTSSGKVWAVQNFSK